MNILFVSENFPYPLDRGGHIRSASILKELSRQFSVTLLTGSGQAAGNHPGLNFFRQFCKKVICLPKPQMPAWKRGYYLLEGLVGGKPYPLNKNFSVPFLQKIREELQSGDYQVLHCDHLDTAQYLYDLPKPIPCVFDTHNIIFLLMERMGQQEKSAIKRLYLHRNAQQLGKYEAEIWPLFDLCLVCSEQEAQQIGRFAPKAKTAVIPNGVDIDFYQTIAGTSPANPTLLFVGRLDYFPNTQGVLFFYQSVWPLLLGQIPQIRWQIVGGVIPPALQELKKDARIKISEKATDMRPYLAASTISIVPLHIGGGTRLKILEAMAVGLPVVSTAIGAEGIDAVNGQEIIIADQPQELAQQIIELCKNADKRQKIALAASSFVTRYDWQVIGKKLISCYNDLK
ncbi:MAG: glycosyltransferase [Candidatus Schekmanbacteria bacterium]|nr:glycosyltransferase [Candidatus Schekmanbacteria bacterium]